MWSRFLVIFFFFNDTPTTEIYTLSLHDALPICSCRRVSIFSPGRTSYALSCTLSAGLRTEPRSEEHTSELQSRGHLVCRLLLEKKKIYKNPLKNSAIFDSITY